MTLSLLQSAGLTLSISTKIMTKRRVDSFNAEHLHAEVVRGASLAGIDSRGRPASGRVDPRVSGEQRLTGLHRGQRCPGCRADYRRAARPGDSRPDAARRGWPEHLPQ